MKGEKLFLEYVKSYSSRNLREMREFYLAYPIWRAVSAKLNWSQYKLLL